MRETAELARAARRAAAHAPRRDRRRGGLLPRALRRAAAAVPRRPRLARRRRLARALHPPRRAEVRADGRDGHGRRPLPRPTAGSAPASRRCRGLLDAGAPVGLGVDGAASNESGELTDDLRAALYVARAKRRAARADRPRGARARHAPRRPLPRPRGRARAPERRRARRRRAVAPGRPRPRGDRRPGRRAGARAGRAGGHADRRRRARRLGRRAAHGRPRHARARPRPRELATAGARRPMTDHAMPVAASRGRRAARPTRC